ncbi:glycosyltransferase family 2 protein [Thermoleophilum album]|uniref:Glycosyltransferase, GT2 family n=1 Tax=Thermoleophilum album TaxID=29539 RepID=A0A1H6FP87_THEAL|nr:glycosyltransferase family 2 protein [Thermoleophilum album]SEH11663.1 Glycosyltransferase, GT2 family [Thermoleophilum album]
MSKPAVSVVVPTRDRPDELALALASLSRLRGREQAELIVVDDGSRDSTAERLARAHGARYLRHRQAAGLNAARNTAIDAAESELIAFVDDDVVVPEQWLCELLAGVTRHRRADAFAGAIVARIEGLAGRGCGRHAPPITALDLGHDDRPVLAAWGACMAIRRRAFERVGVFDASLSVDEGDEAEWFERLRAAGGRVVYLGAWRLEHVRRGRSARVSALLRASYRRGRGARRSDQRRGQAPSLAGELRTLVGCGWHVARRRCPQGLLLAAHALGRTVEATGGRER